MSNIVESSHNSVSVGPLLWVVLDLSGIWESVTIYRCYGSRRIHITGLQGNSFSLRCNAYRFFFFFFSICLWIRTHSFQVKCFSQGISPQRSCPIAVWWDEEMRAYTFIKIKRDGEKDRLEIVLQKRLRLLPEFHIFRLFTVYLNG